MEIRYLKGNKMKVFIEKKEILDELISKRIIELVNKKNDANLGLATGSTPLGIYRALVLDHQKNNTNYQNIKTFNLDEYADLAHDHIQSYHTYMYENLFKHLNINLKNTFFPTKETYLNFSEFLLKNPIDLQILGVGSNGHIGFNEPFTPFDSTTHKVLLAEQTRLDNSRLFENINDVPTHAYSMGLNDIMMAKEIVLMATGKSKAKPIYELIKGELNIEWPCTILKNHPNVTIYIDKDAASLL